MFTMSVFPNDSIHSDRSFQGSRKCANNEGQLLQDNSIKPFPGGHSVLKEAAGVQSDGASGACVRARGVLCIDHTSP